jgi:5-formyltetrahydrofolate cyclo-ligase
MLTKRQLRSKILAKLRKQKEERLKKSRVIKDKLFRLAVFKKAKRVMFYITFGGEVETQEMINAALKMGKIVGVPVCDKKKRTIIPCKIRLREKLKKGLYGIKEPCIKRPLAVECIDLVIVPGVTFDKHGNRMGRGKGYYDSFLRQLPKRTVSVGLAFGFQILPRLSRSRRSGR